MSKSFILIIAVSGLLSWALFAACNKSSPGYTTCNGNPVTADSSALLNFARANGIVPMIDTTGLYYQVMNPGSGASPTNSSKVTVMYKGTLMDGTVFDSTADTTTRSFVLGQLVPGWQIGLPKIKTGGRIKLLIPSAMAFGCAGAGASIPPNAPVYFDVTLVSFQ